MGKITSLAGDVTVCGQRYATPVDGADKLLVEGEFFR